VINIDFQLCKLDEIANLNTTFDFIFGRWALIFSSIPESALLQLKTLLKPGGTLVSEELNFDKDGHFSYPHEPLVDTYHQIVLENSKKANLPLNLADNLYSMFRNSNFANIRARNNQPVFITPEEKSLYRLSLISMQQAIISNDFYTKDQLFKLEEEFKLLETNQDLFIGGYRNILISGSKLPL
jgi:SAM-dependent methyltransferase